MSVCMYVCMCGVCVCVHVFLKVSIYVSIYICVYMYVCICDPYKKTMLKSENSLFHFNTYFNSDKNEDFKHVSCK